MAPSEFSWLADLHKSQCFTTGDWNNPAKTIDFGDGGHTASLTDWHELLQLTAPDSTCGIVFVRGDFPNAADAILARAQQPDYSGQKGSFGLELDAKGSDFVLGERRNQGFVNFRWPHIQYELKRKYSDGGVEQIHIGSYEAISFVKDDVVFQAICLRPGRVNERSRGVIRNANSVLEGSIGSEATVVAEEDSQTRTPSKLKVRLRLGGDIRFGCPCSTARLPRGEESENLITDKYEVSSMDDGKRLLCTSSWYQKRLEMQLFINDKSTVIDPDGSRRSKLVVQGGKVNFHATQDVELEAGTPTFIVATFALRKYIAPEPMLGFSSFISIADYLGFSNDSKNMSDRLWTACLTTNYDSSEATEFCAIGTAVEQTLCVSSVPMSIESNEGLSSNPTLSRNQENTGIALIRNIMAGQYVDLQSSFWQIRLLVKTHEFLRSRRFELDMLDTVKALNDVRSFYLAMLRSRIRRMLIWLLEANIEPGKVMLPVNRNEQSLNVENEVTSDRLKYCLKRRNLIKPEKSHDQNCFVPIIIWYVMKHCPDAITSEFKNQFIKATLGKFYSPEEKQESKVEDDSSAKNNVLHWLRLSCLTLILQETFGKDANNQDIDGFMVSGVSRRDLSRPQERREKAITRLRKSKTETTSSEDEEVDRLFLLAEELGFQSLRSQSTSSLAIARARQVRAKATERKPTTRFHPGPKPFRNNSTSRVVSNAPWELFCLNHHTILRTTLDRSSELNVQACRDACLEFLLSDYSFMSSWDRADKAMLEKWWDFETASVICTTILDLKAAGILKSAPPERKAEDLTKSTTDLAAAPPEGEGQVNQTGTSRGNLPRADSLRDLIQLLKQELVQSDSGSIASNKPFDWLAWKPSRYHHPKCWVGAVDGVGKVSKLISTKKLPPQLEIVKYLSGTDEVRLSQSIETHMKEIGPVLPEDLEYVSIFDLVASYDFTFWSREFRSVGKKGPVYLPSDLLRPKKTTDWNPMLGSEEKKLEALNRTLVDSGTKYRILFTERCCPSILKAFICGWHPDALDTFDNYFGTSSRFSNTREAMWTTTITISHWSIRSPDLSKEYPVRFHEGRTKGDFPPPSIANLESKSRKSKQQKTEKQTLVRVIEERSTSLVITGDPQGFFWLCTIWSSLTKSKNLAVSISSLPAILQSFIHQQASGRCLVFLILLGHICERLAREHDRMLDQLNTVVDLGEKILLDGIELEASDAVEKLKKMLWGLEALRVFDDRLSSSLSQIRNAREALDHIINQEAAQQDIELIQEYKNVLEEFAKRYGILSDVQIKIQLRIRQVTGLRDGISTVTNVQDSRTALEDSQTTIKQGNNIRVLTLITIAYLPLGFVTGLFSNNQNLLPEGTGATLYIILNVTLSVATYIIALSLGTILGVVQPRWDAFKEKILPKTANGVRRAESLEMQKMGSGVTMTTGNRDGNGNGEAGHVEWGHEHGRPWSGSQRVKGNILPLVRIDGVDREENGVLYG